MKKILVFLMTLASISATAQTLNFDIADGSKVYWQKVFNKAIAPDEIETFLLNDGRFVDVMNNNGVVTCKVSEAKIDYKALGYAYGDIPFYISLSNISFFATIQAKEDRYRVTVENVLFTVAADNGIFKKGEETALEEVALKKGAFKAQFLRTPGSAVLNRYFTDLFTLQAKSYLDNEW